ncbi:unnamed protein product [Linum trigynum]|uniref:TF-B3 domain-containing protein n=1 Tax=Linum trigynum TaxID=586398 RepID=A0AAV2F061_9ROSI
MTIPQVKKEQEKNGRPGKVKVSSSNKQERGIVPTKSGFKRATSETVYVNSEVKDAVMKRAQELEASLPRNFPTMIKLMLPSHISGGFWLGLCKKFCVKHLGEKDMMMDLEDEDGKVFPVNCLVGKTGLSGGWRKFSTDHKLVKGDVVVFQLVKANKFMVYIVRARDFEQNDVALGLLKLEKTSLEEKSSLEEVEGALDLMELDCVLEKKSAHAKDLSRSGKATVAKTVDESDISSDDNYEPEDSENGSDEGFGFDVLDGIRMSSASAVDFQQVKSFDDFDIIVNGLVINSELSKHLQLKYYELCSSQKLFLHEQILNGLNCKLIAGVIAETINIADAIRASKFNGGGNDNGQQKEDFVTWESTLLAFQKLGMNVEFILTRLRQLMRLCDNANRCKRLKTERVEVGKEVKVLEAKLEESVRRMRRIDEEIEKLEIDDVEDVEVKFRELAKAPWTMTILQVKEEQAEPIFQRPSRSKGGFVPIKSTVSSYEPENDVMRKAQEIVSNLSANFPSLIKVMHPSHVNRGASVRLLAEFCHKHLPEEDSMIELEDENGEVDTTKYLAYKNTFSAGWAAFASKHDLVEGDVLVFVLLKPTKFKVYIVRTSRSEGVDGALDMGKKPVYTNNRSTSGKSAFKTVHDSDLSSDDNYVLDESKNESDEDFGFDIPDGIRMSSESTVDFRQVKSFADFDIIVNGLVINSELSKQLQHKYYELCSSQKLFLHERILDGLNCKLIAGVISQTINIADAIRASELGTQQKEEFVTWESTLSAFEKLGMNVEFILIRLRRLMGLCGNVNRLKRLKTERAEVGEKVKALEALLEKWARRTKMIDEEIERLELNDVVGVQARYRELAKSPW